MKTLKSGKITGPIVQLRDLPYRVTNWGLAIPPLAKHKGRGEKFYAFESANGILIYVPAVLIDEAMKTG